MSIFSLFLSHLGLTYVFHLLYVTLYTYKEMHVVGHKNV